MAWRRLGDMPLSEPMMIRLPTHICVTQPQWVKDENVHLLQRQKGSQIFTFLYTGQTSVMTLSNQTWYSIQHCNKRIEYKSKYKFIKDTLFLVLTGKLCNIYCEYFREKLWCYNGTILCIPHNHVTVHIDWTRIKELHVASVYIQSSSSSNTLQHALEQDQLK